MSREGLRGERERELWEYSKEELKEKRDKEAKNKNGKEERSNYEKQLEAKLVIELTRPKEKREVNREDLEAMFENATKFAKFFAEKKKETTFNA